MSSIHGRDETDVCVFAGRSSPHEQDPNNLLKGNGNEGITVCLLERGHPGLRLGDRHDPSASRYVMHAGSYIQNASAVQEGLTDLSRSHSRSRSFFLGHTPSDTAAET